MTKPSVRIAEDEHGPRAAYEDIIIRQDLGTLQWTITEDDIEKQSRIDEDYDDAFVRGREHVEFESIGRDEAGQILFKTRRTHVLDLADRNAPRQGRGIDSGVKSEKI
jgi:hypothetical protein